MTKQELNRDIKRLYNKIESLKNSNTDDFFTFLDNEGKKEYLRLYKADTTTEYLNKNSLVMMLRLNQSYRFVALHLFYINAKL